MKNSNGTIGNRTRDLRVCSAVSQPTGQSAVGYGIRNPLGPVQNHFPITVHYAYGYSGWCYMGPARPCCTSFPHCYILCLRVYRMVLYGTRTALLHIISPLLYTMLTGIPDGVIWDPHGPAAHHFPITVHYAYRYIGWCFTMYATRTALLHIISPVLYSVHRDQPVLAE